MVSYAPACEEAGLVQQHVALDLAEMDCPFDLLKHICELEKGHFGPHLCWCGLAWKLRDQRAVPAYGPQ